MSRTYRRKNSPLPDWVTQDWSNHWRCHGVPKEGKILVKAIAEYHADYGCGTWHYACPSKWYRSNEHRKLRMQHKQELIRYYKNEEHEIQLADKTQSWSWW